MYDDDDDDYDDDDDDDDDDDEMMTKMRNQPEPEGKVFLQLLSVWQGWLALVGGALVNNSMMMMNMAMAKLWQ